MPDREVIARFVAFLREHGHAGLKVERWPDRENRESPEIDAIAGPFAIEHTSVDTVENQRRETAHFAKVVSGLREEVAGRIPCRLTITVEWSAVKVGQDWSDVRSALRDWILTKAPNLPNGRNVIDEGTITGIPFGLSVYKASDRPPRVNFGRFSPQDDTLAARIRKQLDAKASKLGRYSPEKTTILLVESSDLALMNQAIMLGAIKAAYSGALPAAVDEVWYADTTVTGGAVVFTNFKHA